MGDTAHKFAKGLEASTITLDFLNDNAATTVIPTLRAAYGTTVPLTLSKKLVQQRLIIHFTALQF
jgi:hypothetical protein